MTAFPTAFGIFALLLDFAILGFLVWVWVGVARRRKEMFVGVEWIKLLKNLLFLVFLLFCTAVMFTVLIWGIPFLFE